MSGARLGEDRAAFMARVSAALGRREPAAPAEPPPAVDDAVVRVTGRIEDLAAVFEQRAVATGMVVHRTTAPSLAARVAELAAGLGVRRAAVADGPGMVEVGRAIAGAGIERVSGWGVPGFAPLYEADAGITDVQAAIAETGSLVCWSGPGRGRGLSLAPPVHIAVVMRSQIVPDLIDYWPRHSTEPLPANIVLITGPSKTADIEGVLVTGVHGPREVHILLVEDA
jgi:L-lactate dehydrogenase complex protein LldG